MKGGELPKNTAEERERGRERAMDTSDSSVNIFILHVFGLLDRASP